MAMCLELEATHKRSVSHSTSYSGLCPNSAQPGTRYILFLIRDGVNDPWSSHQYILPITEMFLNAALFFIKNNIRESLGKLKWQNDIY